MFGSYARGDTHEESDLDICILVPELTQRRIDMKVGARAAIRSIFPNFPLPIDLKLYTYDEFELESVYKSTLQHTIKEEGLVLDEQQHKGFRVDRIPGA